MANATARRRLHLPALTAMLANLLMLGLGPPAVFGQEGPVVTVVDFAFQPVSLTAAPGAAVNWTNSGAVRHTVTADDGAFDSGPFGPGASFSQVFTVVGSYPYHCAIHQSMIGTIVVAEAGSPPPKPTPGPITTPPKTGVGSASSGWIVEASLLAGVIAGVLGMGAIAASRRP